MSVQDTSGVSANLSTGLSGIVTKLHLYPLPGKAPQTLPDQPIALDGITTQRHQKDLPFGFMKGFYEVPPMSDDDDEDQKSNDGDEAMEVADDNETKEKIPQVEIEEIAQRLKKNKELTQKMEKNAQKTAATFDAIIAKYELLEYTKGAEDDELSEEEDIPPNTSTMSPTQTVSSSETEGPENGRCSWHQWWNSRRQGRRDRMEKRLGGEERGSSSHTGQIRAPAFSRETQVCLMLNMLKMSMEPRGIVEPARNYLRGVTSDLVKKTE